MNLNFLALCLVLTHGALSAQEQVYDATDRIPSLNFNAAFHLPGGDLKDRFGSSFMFGMEYQLKGETNYYWGAEVTALVGSEVRAPNIIDVVTVDDGDVINVNGNIAEVRLWERGAQGQLFVGKIFPVIGPNKNSGIFLQAGAGYMYHKIRIETIGEAVPQLNEDLKKGYDRLCMGFATSQVVGYRHFSNHQRINFYIGLEFIQAFTEDVRAYDYNTRSANQDKRLDLLSGLKFGWTLPLFQKTHNQYYYH